MGDRFWWLVHNLVVHPIFAFFPNAEWADRLHEETARGRFFRDNPEAEFREGGEG